MSDPGKYPWHRLLRTVVLYKAFLSYGIAANLFGPTILDLKVHKFFFFQSFYGVLLYYLYSITV